MDAPPQLNVRDSKLWSTFMDSNSDRFARDYKLLGVYTVKKFQIKTTDETPIYMYHNSTYHNIYKLFYNL